MSSKDTEGEDVPAWRLDPEESYSDWIIEVIGKDSGSKAVYHVHKFALAFGPRKSDYFMGVFRHTNELSESTKSTVTLEDSAAAVFSEFLDYIYTGKVDLKTENAVELHHLGNYFGVDSLNQLTQEFLLEKIQGSDALVCLLPRILVFRDKFLMEHAVLLCTDSVLCSDPIESTFDYDFLLEIVKLCSDVVHRRDVFEETNDSGEISNFVLEWMKAHRGSLDPEKFLVLVHEDNLPSVSHDSALEFLELEREFLCPTISASGGSSLQKRCISAIASNSNAWSIMTEEDQNKLIGLINACSKATVVDFLVSCMKGKRKRKHRDDGEHHIVVKGSSETSVNGVWKKRAHAEMPDKVKYHKHGTWKGESCEFVILNDGLDWHIAVSSSRNDAVFQKLYEAIGEGGSEIPPAWGWGPYYPDHAARGFPLLFFCPGDVEDD